MKTDPPGQMSRALRKGCMMPWKTRGSSRTMASWCHSRSTMSSTTCFPITTSHSSSWKSGIGRPTQSAQHSETLHPRCPGCRVSQSGRSRTTWPRVKSRPSSASCTVRAAPSGLATTTSPMKSTGSMRLPWRPPPIDRSVQRSAPRSGSERTLRLSADRVVAHCSLISTRQPTAWSGGTR